jgi:hypothetical protein
MSRRTSFGRKLRIEGLERRYLLAGDVTVKVAGGNLLLTGDNKDNFVIVSGTGTAGQFVVTGESDGNGIATNIRYNNTNNGDVIVNGITAIIVDLKDGNNGFGLTNASLSGSVNIATGSGNDTVAIGDTGVLTSVTVLNAIRPLQIIETGAVSIGGNLNIQTGGGNDLVEIGEGGSLVPGVVTPKVAAALTTSFVVYVQGNVNIDTGAGNDEVEMGIGNVVSNGAVPLIKPQLTIASTGVGVGGDLNINTGAGNDFVLEAGLVVYGSQNLNVGDGSNEIDLVEAGGVASGNAVSAAQGEYVGNNFNITCGKGNDSVDAYNVTVGGSLNLSDAGGTNTFDFSLAQIGRSANFNVAGTNEIDLGQDDGLGVVLATRLMVGGDLNVNATGTTHILESLTRVGHNESIYLGAGNDTLSIDTTTVVGALYADGAGGTNLLTLGAGNSFGKSIFTHWISGK